MPRMTQTRRREISINHDMLTYAARNAEYVKVYVFMIDRNNNLHSVKVNGWIKQNGDNFSVMAHKDAPIENLDQMLTTISADQIDYYCYGLFGIREIYIKGKGVK